jgi:hypothetical protein
VEAHEGHAVVDEKLGTLVGKIVHRLDYVTLEHHHRIEGRPSSLRAVGINKRRDQIGEKTSRRREKRYLLRSSSSLTGTSSI